MNVNMNVNSDDSGIEFMFKFMFLSTFPLAPSPISNSFFP
jgi:hypothetical protein